MCAILLAGFAASLALNLPGHLSYDSLWQLWQGRSGTYNLWHPPVMAWLLGVGDSIVPGAGLFVAFDALLLFGGMLAFALLRGRASWWAALVAAVWALSAQGLVYPGIVWKDVLFAAAMLAGFAALAHAEVRWTRPRWRWPLLLASLVLLSLAALARQNGAVVLPFAAAAIGWIAARQAPQPGLRSGLPMAVAWFVGAALLVAVSTLGLQARSDHEASLADQISELQVYDLSGAVAAQPALRLDLIGRAAPELEQAIRGEGARLYTPRRIDPLQASPVIDEAISDAPPAPIAAQWRDLIFRHPWLYLRVRAAAFGWVVLTPDPKACVPVFTGVDPGGLESLLRLHMAPRKTPKDRLLASYALGLTHTPLYSHLAYAALAVTLLVLMLRRRNHGDLAAAGMLAGVIAFTVTFAVVSVACDYRYLYALDVAAVGACLYWVAGLGRARPSPRPAAAD